MTFFRFIKFNYTRGLIVLGMALLITACNTGGSAVGVNSDTGGDRSVVDGGGLVDVVDGGNVAGGNVVDSGTGTVTIDWVAPAARADGTALSLSDIAGYKVYYGKASGEYPNSLEIKDSTTQSTTVPVTSGLYYFVVSCLDTAGHESIYSKEFKITI